MQIRNNERRGNDEQAITLDTCTSFWNEHLRPLQARHTGCSAAAGSLSCAPKGNRL